MITEPLSPYLEPALPLGSQLCEICLLIVYICRTLGCLLLVTRGILTNTTPQHTHIPSPRSISFQNMHNLFKTWYRKTSVSTIGHFSLLREAQNVRHACPGSPPAGVGTAFHMPLRVRDKWSGSGGGLPSIGLFVAVDTSQNLRLSLL